MLAISVIVLVVAAGVLLRARSAQAAVRADIASVRVVDEVELERHHDHAQTLAVALDDAVFDACKAAGVPACNGRADAVDERCIIAHRGLQMPWSAWKTFVLGTVHRRTVQTAHLIADMVRDMGDGADIAAKQVALLGDALREVVRPGDPNRGADSVVEPSGDSAFSVAMTGPPLVDIRPGLYELEMRDGTRQLAAVGRTSQGDTWWAACGGKRCWMMWDWSEVAGATCIRMAGEP